MLVLLGLFSIDYGMEKRLGLILPIGFLIIAAALAGWTYFYSDKITDKLRDDYKKALTGVIEALDTEKEGTVKKYRNSFMYKTVIPATKRLVIGITVITVILTALFSVWRALKVFTPEKWQRGGVLRMLMADDFIERQNSTMVGEKGPEYCLRGVSDEEVNKIFYDERIEDIPLDITVSIPPERVSELTSYGQELPRIRIFYVYTTPLGKNYWLILYYVSQKEGSFVSAEFLCSGMERVYHAYSSDEYGKECRYWW